MSEAPLSKTSKEEITESINIEKDNKNYLLIMKIKEEVITFKISEPEELGSLTYLRKMTLKEIKEKGKNNIFFGLNSCNDFLDYLKALSEMKKISINKKEDKLSFNFEVEYLLKKHSIEIDLFPEKMNLDSIVRELCKEVNLLKEKIKISENNYKEETQIK